MLSCPYVPAGSGPPLCFLFGKRDTVSAPPAPPCFTGLWNAGDRRLVSGPARTAMPPWGSATRCVDRRGSRLPGAQEGPAVSQLGRNTQGGGHLWLQGAERGHGGLWGTWCMAVGAGAGGSGQWRGGTFCCTRLAPFPTSSPTSENVSRSWDREYTCPNCPNCQHPEFPPWLAPPTITTDCVMVPMRGSAHKAGPGPWDVLRA